MKLTATTVNNVGLAIVGLAVVRPFIDASTKLVWLNIVAWTVVGLAMHVISHYILLNMKREKKED